MNGVIDSLRSAQSWGTWDLLGGGLASTAVKHSRINDARDSVHRIQQKLMIFLRELKDIDPKLKSEVSIDIGALATFADYFFDGVHFGLNPGERPHWWDFLKVRNEIVQCAK